METSSGIQLTHELRSPLDASRAAAEIDDVDGAEVERAGVRTEVPGRGTGDVHRVFAVDLHAVEVLQPVLGLQPVGRVRASHGRKALAERSSGPLRTD